MAIGLRDIFTWMKGNLKTLPEEQKVISSWREVDVIVSLTSYPPRFPTLHKVIEKLLAQSLKPARVCLWIGVQDMPLLPAKVRELKAAGLEIYEIPDFKSYNKIIHCQTMFPGSVIVTADDDVAYPGDWLRYLYAYHLQNPGTVICHRARYMTFQPNLEVNPYWLWPNLDREMESPMVFPLGVGGVLYPCNCFYEDVGRHEIFTELCSHGDDIWLKAMTLLNGTPCRKIHNFPKYFRHVRGTQRVNLKSRNLDFKNDEQIQRVFKKYEILHKLQQVTDNRAS